MRTRAWILSVGVVVFAFSIGRGIAEDKPKPTPTPDKAGEWMKKKLELSQAILDGLTHGDFAAVEGDAQRLNLVGYLEKLLTVDKPQYKEYMRQLSYFEMANRELLRQARAKNVEGAVLAYNQLNTSCVQCHKVVRDSKKP